MTNLEDKPFLTIKEVSNLIGLSVSTINRLVKKGEFPPKVKISPRRMVFMKDEIEDWIFQRTKSNNRFIKNYVIDCHK